MSFTLQAFHLPGSNMEAALKRTGGNQGLLERMLVVFCSSHADTAENLRSLLTSDLEEARRMAHNLKGTAISVGLDGLSTDAAALEQALKQGSDTDAVMLTLEKSLQQALEALRRAGIN